MTSPAPEEAMPRLSEDQLARLLVLLEDADSVELKVTLRESDQRSSIAALGIDPLDAQIRQVAFFDTTGLDLNRSGLLLRARRIQGRKGDVIVKIRPPDGGTLPAAVRGLSGIGVEVDAVPGGFVCSGTVKQRVKDKALKAVMAEQVPMLSILDDTQREALDVAGAPQEHLEQIVRLGPVTLLKAKVTPPELGRVIVAELWFQPDGSRTLELSTKATVDDAFTVAAEVRGFLADKGIDLTGDQQSKTAATLKAFASWRQDDSARR